MFLRIIFLSFSLLVFLFFVPIYLLAIIVHRGGDKLSVYVVVEL